MGGAELNMGGGTLMSMTERGGGARGGGVLALTGDLARPGDREPDLEPLGVLGDLGGVEVGVWGDRVPGPSISYRGESAVGVPGVPGVLEAGVSGVSAAEEWTGESRLMGGGWVRVKLRSGGSTLVPGEAR